MKEDLIKYLKYLSLKIEKKKKIDFVALRRAGFLKKYQQKNTFTAHMTGAIQKHCCKNSESANIV